MCIRDSYTNGALCATKSGMTPFARGNYSLQIGGPGFPYHGSLDEFRVWNTARSQAQILADMNSPLVGNETNLLLYYQMCIRDSPQTTRTTAPQPAFNPLDWSWLLENWYRPMPNWPCPKRCWRLMSEQIGFALRAKRIRHR